MGNDKEQIDKFKDAARELECDDDDQRFAEGLGGLIGVPVTFLLEGDPPRLLDTIYQPQPPSVGQELELLLGSETMQFEVTRTQATTDNPESLFASCRHWACVRPLAC